MTETSLGEEGALTETLLEDEGTVSNVFNVYPNPVKEELFITLSSNENTKIEIIDMQGRVLYKADISGSYEHTIPIKDLNINSGIMFVRETTDKSVVTKRVIVNK